MGSLRQKSSVPLLGTGHGAAPLGAGSLDCCHRRFIHRPARTPSKLSESVHEWLNMYALAASAAGVSLLAPQPSDARVVYTKTHRVIGTNGMYALDLNHNGTMDFQIRESGNTLGTAGDNALIAKEARGNAVEGYVSQYRRLVGAALKKGMSIGRHRHFVSDSHYGEVMASVFQTDEIGLHYYGPWLNVTNRYLGLRFKIHGKTHYGWARLSVRVQGRHIAATLTGYAYETVPIKSIIAGKTAGPDEVGSAHRASDAAFSVRTPKPATLGLLALGSHGLGK